jgi:S1-C subfamily serine protease
VVGEPVAAIGSPFGQQNSLAVGVVSATERRVDSLTSDYSVIDAIQTDAPITHGNSGGPLFNARGEVIGINAQIRTESGGTEGVGFAIPINSARRSLEQLLESGRVEYAWMGIQAQTISPQLARELDLPEEGGAVVQSVLPGSPAEKAGLRAGTIRRQVLGITLNTGGDVIVAIDGIAIHSTEDLIRTLASQLQPGQTAQFTVVREGRRVTLPVVLEDRPPDPEG